MNGTVKGAEAEAQLPENGAEAQTAAAGDAIDHELARHDDDGGSLRPTSAASPEGQGDDAGGGDGGSDGDDSSGGAPAVEEAEGETGEEAEAEELAPEVEALRPTFTHDMAYEAARAAAEAVVIVGFGEGDNEWPYAGVHSQPIHDLFGFVRKTRGAAPVETYYRQLHGWDDSLPPWGEHGLAFEVGLSAFVTTAAALCAIADEQLQAFENAIRAAAKGDRLGAMRKAKAGRRKKKAERKARSPAARAKLAATIRTNRANTAKAARAPKLPAAKPGKAAGKKGKR